MTCSASRKEAPQHELTDVHVAGGGRSGKETPSGSGWRGWTVAPHSLDR